MSDKQAPQNRQTSMTSRSAAVPASGLDVLDDEALLLAYKNGDPRAFAVLVKRHQGPVYRFCLRSLGDTTAATDATQEVFLRVVKNVGSWERKAKVTTWLYTIARNHLIDEARKKKHRRTESLDEAAPGKDGGDGVTRLERTADTAPDAGRRLDGARVRDVVDRTLRDIPEEQREVFCLREYGGLGFGEIATQTGTNENTVKSRMRYAMQALQKALLSAGFHAGG